MVLVRLVPAFTGPLRAGCHEALTETDPDGTRYRVDESGLLLWMHCSEATSRADIARRGRLPKRRAPRQAGTARRTP